MNEDQTKLLNLLKSSKKCFLMVAPSFPIDFDYKTFVPLMKSLGFDKVTELTFGAKIVNKEYREYINNNPSQEKFIASVCPSIVNLVKTQSPENVKYLLPYDSPMVSMAKIIKKNYPDYEIVFLSPCFAKKVEAANSGLISVAVTYKELKEIIDEKKPKIKSKNSSFDALVNEYTKIYPITGGLAKTMNSKNIFKKNEELSTDSCKNINEILSKKGIKFFDILFCKGGCIGGNGILSNESTAIKKKKILKYKEIIENKIIGKKRGLIKETEGISFNKKF